MGENERDCGMVLERFACPDCGERERDRLIYDDLDWVHCQACGAVYDPATGERQENDVLAKGGIND